MRHDISLGAVLTCWFIGSAAQAAPAQKVADHFQIEKYAGTWYEIARFYEINEVACENAIATYTPFNDGSGKIQVLNQCDRAGSHSKFQSEAHAPNPKEPARLVLAVDVLGHRIDAPYNVLAVDNQYQWALVGEPDHHHLWVLSRQPYIDAKVLQTLLKRAESEFGYSKVQERLHCTRQAKSVNSVCEAVLRSAA